jgi:hypothetical protein
VDGEEGREHGAATARRSVRRARLGVGGGPRSGGVPRLRGCGVAARAGVVSLPCSVHEKEGREGRLRPAGGQGCGQDSYGRPLTEMPLRRAGIFARALSESCHGKPAPACPVAFASGGHPAPRLLLVVVATQKFEQSQNTTVGVSRLGSLSRRVNVAACPSSDGSSTWASAKGGSKVAGDGRERGGNPADFVFVLRPGRVRLQ